MFPNESANARVFRDRLVRTVGQAIIAAGALSHDVVHIDCGLFGDLVAQDIGNIVVEYGHGVRPTHRKRGQAMRTKGGLEGREVARRFGDFALIVTDEKVERSDAWSRGELLDDILGDRRDAGMLYRYGVKRFQTVDEANATVLLRDREPPRTIARVGGFVDPARDLLANLVAYLVVQPRWDWNIAQDPRLVGNSRDLDWRKEVAAKASSLSIGPREPLLLVLDHVVH